jgi:hypothetical protein
MREFQQPPAQPLSLERRVNGKIGQIGAVLEICQRSSDAHQQSFRRACSNGQVGVPKHALDAFVIIHGSACGKGGPMQDVDEFICRQIRFDSQGNGTHEICEFKKSRR